MTKGRDLNKEEFWRRTIQDRADSGMTIEDFCAERGLKSTAYHYWQREIKRRDDEAMQAKSVRPSAALAQVQLVEDRDGLADVEIVATNGYVVRVADSASTEHVKRVLQAVSELD